MQVKEAILEEIERMPEEYLGKVLDFMRHLESKTASERVFPAIAAETALRKDWLEPEEDEAWRNL